MGEICIPESVSFSSSDKFVLYPRLHSYQTEPLDPMVVCVYGFLSQNPFPVLCFCLGAEETVFPTVSPCTSREAENTLNSKDENSLRTELVISISH